jgi:peptide-methionine (S)-S-oxide reductase
MKKEKATFGMGCFWSPQLLFSETKGVLKADVGYMGGEEKKKNYSYEDVSYKNTGHAEVVQIEFDSDKISYRELLRIFWTSHDPTTMNRQGPDIGKQYRSVIFYYNENQKKQAEESKRVYQEETGNKKIVTQIIEAGIFYKAEEYHQDFLKKRGLKVCH